MPKGNPNGTLAGFSDRSEPGWQERVIAAVAKNQAGRVDRAHPEQIRFNIGTQFMRLLRDAAQARGMSMSSYCRRAVAAFISVDTGVAFEQIVGDSTGVRPFGGAEVKPRGVDDGQGYGLWRIEALREH